MNENRISQSNNRTDQIKGIRNKNKSISVVKIER